MNWPDDSYEAQFTPRPPFAYQVGVSTPYAATIYFTPNDDICGESYRGYDYTVSFEDRRLNSDLWNYEGTAGNAETVSSEAADKYRQMVQLFERLKQIDLNKG